MGSGAPEDGTKSVDVDLSGSDGNRDGAADAVVVHGTPGSDRVAIGTDSGAEVVDGLAAETAVTGGEASDTVTFQVTRSDGRVTVAGLPATVQLTGSEPADTLGIKTLAGKAVVSVVPDVAALVTPSVDLGPQ